MPRTTISRSTEFPNASARSSAEYRFITVKGNDKTPLFNKFLIMPDKAARIYFEPPFVCTLPPTDGSGGFVGGIAGLWLSVPGAGGFDLVSPVPGDGTPVIGWVVGCVVGESAADLCGLSSADALLPAALSPLGCGPELEFSLGPESLPFVSAAYCTTLLARAAPLQNATPPTASDATVNCVINRMIAPSKRFPSIRRGLP
jgi:hypothetical protein